LHHAGVIPAKLEGDDGVDQAAGIVYLREKLILNIG